MCPILATGVVLLNLVMKITNIAPECYFIFLSLVVCTGIGMGCMVR